MTFDFCPSSRPDNSLYVNSDSTRLLKRPSSSRSPRVLNNSSAHVKSHSVSHPHLRCTAQQQLDPSLSTDQDPSASYASNPNSSVNKAPSTPPRKHRHSSSLSCATLTHSSSISSFDTSSESSPCFVFAVPSPLSLHTPTRSQRFKTPPPSSSHPPFPPRARATLAMSVQVHSAILDSPSNHFHQPSPRLPQQSLLDLYPGPASHPRQQSSSHPSRPVSPAVNMRPSSRSEKLLRDTLRRAEEYDRVHEHTSSPLSFLSSKLQTQRRDEDDFDCECDDIQGLLFKSASSGVSGEINITLPSKATLVRHKSLDQKSVRSGTSPPVSRRSTMPRSPKSTSSHEEHAIPHDAVLRSRLDGVLNQAREQKRCNGNRSVSRPRTHTRSSSDDWMSASSSPPLVHSQHLPPSSPRQASLDSLTPPLTPPHAPATLYRSPSDPSHPTSPRINRSPHSPHTPSSPSFNARTASAMCRQIDGYVSFANVEGLGAPPETDDEDDDTGHNQNWLRWFGLKPATVNNAYETSARA